MLASPEVRLAIKDSRGQCRSRWLGHHTEMRGRSADTSRPVQVSGHGWFTDGLRPEHGHSRRGHVHGHGLTADAIVATASDCSRTRTVRDHGEIADADAVTDWTRTACGYGHRRGHLPARLRFHRDCFADSKTSVCRGVTRASSKTSRLRPCECQSVADQVRTDLPASRMRLDRLKGHFPFRQRISRF